MAVVAAIDLGASSARVIRVSVRPDRLELTEVHRVANRPVRAGGTLHWNALGLYQAVLDGLRLAGPVDSLGIDSWAVDYGLLDADGALLGNPVSYRDSRTNGVMERVLAQAGAPELYALTGLQNLPFNTIFQLVSARPAASLRSAATLLLLPDLLAYWLTGNLGAELTNASTTGLLRADTHEWAYDLIGQLGLNPALFPPLRRPGEVIGSTDAIPVIAVGSHDTASAVVAVPAVDSGFAYISCGTWSLAGIELGEPVLTEASRLANFTNEVGVDGRIRYLRNVMGLWLLQECLREEPSWQLEPLLREAARSPGGHSLFDPGDPVFLPPGNMRARIEEACRRLAQPVPAGPAALVRSILDSLAQAHARALHDAQRLSGKAVTAIHIVGGGSRNALLCQLTADACGLPVIAGPAEATAIGNALVQARTLGAISGSLTDLRALVREHSSLVHYEPRA
jgi:sugar (pentulose or hexulose) kinase